MTAPAKVRILVVEDEKNHATVLAELLERSGYAVDVATTFDEGTSLLARGGHDIVITDLDLGAHRGTEILEQAMQRELGPEVMLISGVGSIEDAVQSMHLGAVHYFTKPLNVGEIRSVVGDSADRVRARRQRVAPQVDTADGFEGIIGRSPALLRVFETIDRVAPTVATVLIQGENGTGKELVAKAIHNRSPRRKEPFVALNCAALSEGILESELFGHERGAFTGAASAREGKFEYADKGTLFLDEVGDMPLSLQVKLLRVLQEREITRVGSNKTIKVDVRLLVATNKDLEKEIQEGRFREDLYYRIKVVSILMPPLRERAEDIRRLVRTFLEDFSREHGSETRGITEEAMKVLEAQPWPGNVRQLRNTVETMVLLATGPELTNADIPPEIQPASSPSTALVSLDDFSGYTLDQWEKELIRLQLERQDGNRAKVAKALGISERTLYRKLKEYDLR